MGYEYIPHIAQPSTSTINIPRIGGNNRFNLGLNPILNKNPIVRSGGNYCYDPCKDPCIDPCDNPCGFLTRSDIILFGLVFVIFYLIFIFSNPVFLRKAGTDEVDTTTTIILSLFIALIALAFYSLKNH